MSKAPKSESSQDEAMSGSGEQEVGYRKPPKEHQFKSGNTLGKGRPKGAKNLKTIVNEALGQKVAVKMGGKTKKLSKVELMVHQVATKASQGDLKAADRALALFERYGPQEDTERPEPEKIRRDRGALRDQLAMMDLVFPPEDDEEAENGGE
jgi:hypothetical protein